MNALVEDYQRLARETRVRSRSKQRYAGSALPVGDAVPYSPITITEVEEKLQAKNVQLTYQGLRKESKSDVEKEESDKETKVTVTETKKTVNSLHDSAFPLLPPSPTVDLFLFDKLPHWNSGFLI